MAERPKRKPEERAEDPRAGALRGTFETTPESAATPAAPRENIKRRTELGDPQKPAGEASAPADPKPETVVRSSNHAG